VPRLVLQGTKDSFGTPEELRAVIGNAPGISVVELAGANHGFRIVGAQSTTSASRTSTAKSSPLNPTELRTTVVAEVSRFIGAVAGISTS
jgi:hypothetical protein